MCGREEGVSVWEESMCVCVCDVWIVRCGQVCVMSVLVDLFLTHRVRIVTIIRSYYLHRLHEA